VIISHVSASDTDAEDSCNGEPYFKGSPTLGIAFYHLHDSHDLNLCCPQFSRNVRAPRWRSHDLSQFDTATQGTANDGPRRFSQWGFDTTPQ
jgi:hypothetical protein